MKDNWFERTPVYMFIDTSCFINMNFNLTHPSFATIQTAINAGDIRLIATDILKGEFIKHADEMIHNEKERIRRLGPIRYLAANEVITLETAIEMASGAALWAKFTNIFTPSLSNGDVNWKDVFNDYFKKVVPFSEGKKCEFPDAFNLQLIKNLNPDFLIIVSSDGDFSEAFTGNDNRVHFKKINDFTDAYLKIRNPALVLQSKACFDFHKNEILNKLTKTYSDNSHYYLECAHSEVEDASIEDIMLVSAKNIQLDKDTSIFRITLNGTAKLDLNCPVVVYDSIDKEEVFLGSNSKSMKFKLSINAEIEINFQKTTENSTYEIIDEDFSHEDIEIPHNWISFLEEIP